MTEERTLLYKLLTQAYTDSISNGNPLRKEIWNLSCERHKYSDNKLRKAMKDLNISTDNSSILLERINDLKKRLQDNLNGSNDFGVAMDIIQKGDELADRFIEAKLGCDLWDELKHLGCKASLNSEVMDDNMLYKVDEPSRFRDKLTQNGYVYSKDTSYDDTYSIYKNHEKGTQVFMTCNGFLKISFIDDNIYATSIANRAVAAKNKAAAHNSSIKCKSVEQGKSKESER